MNNLQKETNFLKKRKIRIIIKIFITIVTNLALSGLLLKLILERNLNLGFNYANIFHLRLDKELISILYLGLYLIVSIVLLRLYYNISIKKMYLSCTLDEVDELTGIEFEYFLYYKFKQRGYKVKTTPITGDYGADLVLKKRKEKIVIQAKRYHNDVGISAVQEVIGSIAFYDATEGLVITNSYFTNNAKQLAKANEIILWDRKKLIEEFLQEETLSESSYNEINQGSCPKCGKALVYREGKYGSFIGCSGYPNCKFTTSLDEISMN